MPIYDLEGREVKAGDWLYWFTVSGAVSGGRVVFVTEEVARIRLTNGSYVDQSAEQISSGQLSSDVSPPELECSPLYRVFHRKLKAAASRYCKQLKKRQKQEDRVFWEKHYQKYGR